MGNISDVNNNAYYEAEGPFVCIYVKTWMDLRCSDVYISFPYATGLGLFADAKGNRTRAPGATGGTDDDESSLV